ncbi:hypothetical protein [Yersinia alsatica]|uniref:hypothetical protein n=1 Tax=Yersinia alsatica TaxID=2890317 RepID=UPI0039A3B262
MNRLNKSATFQVVIPSAMSGLILLLTLPVAPAVLLLLGGIGTFSGLSDGEFIQQGRIVVGADDRAPGSQWLQNEGGHNRSRDSQDQLRTQSNSKSRTESRLSGHSARASVDGYSTGVYGSWSNNTVNGQDWVAEEYR